MTTSTGDAALRDLRSARRRNRLTGIHWSDALYRVYILAVGVGGIAWWIATMFGSHRIKDASYAGFERRVAEVVGLVIATAVLLAIRSGLRGGPLAIESAELTHVLMSPVDRRRALQHSVIQQYRRGMYLGSIAGGIAGRLMVPFVVGNRVYWTLAGALVGALTGLLWMAVAMNVSGRHLPKWTQLGALALVAWSANDLRADDPTSPQGWLGRAFWLPLRNWAPKGLTTFERASSFSRRVHDPLLAAAVLAVLAVVVAVLGVVGCAGLRIELAERRAALVSQLRFAVTTQDLRSVLLLRRQLGSEHLRNRPRFTVKGRPGPERAVVVRGLRSVARWPTSRIVRIAMMAIVSGIAARLAYEGTLPLLLVPGLLAFVAGLDAIEPLSQDADHPGLLASYPRHRGRLANRQIIVPAIVLMIAGLLGAVSGWLAGPIAGAGTSVAFLGFGVLFAIAWGAIGTILAAVSVAIGPPSMTLMLQTPELAFGRSLASPGVATAGLIVPIALARAAVHHNKPAGPAFVQGLALTMLVSYSALTVLTSAGIREPKT